VVQGIVGRAGRGGIALEQPGNDSA
jgi:hypothetical protein